MKLAVAVPNGNLVDIDALDSLNLSLDKFRKLVGNEHSDSLLRIATG